MGYYFVTFFASKKRCLFGKNKNGKIKLSILGLIINKYIKNFEKTNTDIKFLEYVIMPNHIHFLIEEKCDIYSSLFSRMKSFKKQINTDFGRSMFELDFLENRIYSLEVYNKVKKYIKSNANTWESDRYYEK